jgi:ABC-2 type transport system permease protein
MSIRRVMALSLRIVRQFARDRRTLGLLFIVPLFVMTILNFVLNNSSSGVTLGVVPPQGPLGQQVVQQLQSRLNGQQSISLKTVDAGAVDDALKNGDADGVLVFPADLAAQLAAGQAPTLTLRLEGSNPGAAQQLRSLTTLLAASLAQVSASPQGATPSPAALAVQTTYLYGGPEYTQTDALAPLFVGLFSFFFVFLLTSVAFLRERSQGTLERLSVSPLSRTELVLGYVLGFTLFALLQSVVILLFVVGVLRVHYAGNLGLLFLVTLVLTISAVNLGIFASAFARNELQVVQFIPLLIVPQALLGGLFFSVDTLPVVLKQAAYIMPITYANFALRDVMLKGFTIDQIWGDLAFLVGFALLMVIGAALSLRQERA